jgi:hypothetical protein
MSIKITILEKPVPPLPFERDESIDSSDVKPRKVMKQAAADLSAGMQDTGRSAEMDATYKKLKRKK